MLFKYNVRSTERKKKYEKKNYFVGYFIKYADFGIRNINSECGI